MLGCTAGVGSSQHSAGMQRPVSHQQLVGFVRPADGALSAWLILHFRGLIGALKRHSTGGTQFQIHSACTSCLHPHTLNILRDQGLGVQEQASSAAHAQAVCVYRRAYIRLWHGICVWTRCLHPS